MKPLWHLKLYLLTERILRFDKSSIMKGYLLFLVTTNVLRNIYLHFNACYYYYIILCYKKFLKVLGDETIS